MADAAPEAGLTSDVLAQLARAAQTVQQCSIELSYEEFMAARVRMLVDAGLSRHQIARSTGAPQLTVNRAVREHNEAA